MGAGDGSAKRVLPDGEKEVAYGLTNNPRLSDGMKICRTGIRHRVGCENVNLLTPRS